MKNLSMDKVLPHLVAIAVFILLTIIFFMPYVKGYDLKQGDITNFQGMAKEVAEHRELADEEPLWTGSMFSGMPAYQISVQYKSSNYLYIADNIFRLFTTNPVWYLFLYMIGFYIFLQCLRINPWLSIVGAIAFGLSTYFLIILEAGHNSKAHAIAYMAPTLGAIILTYRRKLLLGGALTALFLGLELMCNHYQIAYYLGLIILVYVIAEAVKQATSGTLPHFIKASGVLLMAGGLAVGANIAQIWNTLEYGADTTRGKTELTQNPDGSSNANNNTGGLPRDYINEWSYGTGETFNLFIPAAKGNGSGQLWYDESNLDEVPAAYKQQLASQNTYWGNQRFTSGPVYIGAVVIFLAFLSLFYSKSYLKWPLLVLTLLSIILSWGGNAAGLTDLFIDVLPGFNKFRTISMILVIAEFTLPFMAILYLQDLLKYRKEMAADMKGFYIASGIVLFGLLLFLMVPETFFSFLSNNEMAGFTDANYGMYNALVDWRKGVFKADTGRTLLFVLLSGGLIFAYLRSASLSKGILIAGMGLLVTLDMGLVGNRFINGDYLPNGSTEMWDWEKRENKVPYYSTKADQMILQIEMGQHPELQQEISQGLQAAQAAKRESGAMTFTLSQDEKDEVAFSKLRRASNNRVLDLSTSTFNSSRASYFHKSVGGYHGAKMKRYQELIEWHIYNEIGRITSTLNSQPSQAQVAGMFNSLNTLNMLNTRYIIYDGNATPLMNNAALGDAWVVKSAQNVPNADAEIKAVGQINPADEAVYDNRYSAQVGNFTYDPAATIELVDYRTNHLTYEFNAASPQYVVFSEIFYDEWQAYIDGQPADHFRTNYVLRGMVIPAGKHSIEFRMEGKSFAGLTTVTAICSILVLLVTIAAIVMSLMREEKQEEPTVAPQAS